MKLKELEERLLALEAKVNSTEKSGENRIRPSGNDTFVRQNTIHPSEVEVGRLAYVGNFVSKDGHTSSRFGADRNSIQSVLDVVDVDQMANVMSAFANADRLAILRSLLNEQMTATELMERFKFSTTGKLYNHLSKLEDLGLISKAGSVYRVQGRAVSSTILLFQAFANIMREMK